MEEVWGRMVEIRMVGGEGSGNGTDAGEGETNGTEASQT